jgi:hypothetical protein
MIQIPTVVFQAISAGNSIYKSGPDKTVNPSPRSLTLQLHKKSEKKEVKSLRRPVDCGYKEIV